MFIRTGLLSLLVILGCHLASTNDTDVLQKINKSVGPKVDRILQQYDTDRNSGDHTFTLDAMYLEKDDVTIEGVASVNTADVRVRKSDTNMINGITKIDMDLGTIKMRGIGQKDNESDKKIDIYLKDVTATGLLGFKNTDDNKLKLINLNLDYDNMTIDTIQIFVDGEEKDLRDVDQHVKKTFLDNVKVNLEQKVIKKLFQKNLDDADVKDLFRDTKADMSFYRSTAETALVNGNSVADSFIKQLKALIIKNGKQEMPLPFFKKKFLFIKVSGTGALSDLSTINRIGDVSMENTGNNVNLVGSMHLTTFNAHYELTAKMLGMKHSFGANIATTDNNFGVTVNLEDNSDHYNVKDLTVKVTDLGNLQLTFNGVPDFIKKSLEKLSNHLLNLFNGFIAKGVDMYIQSIIDQIRDLKVPKE